MPSDSPSAISAEFQFPETLSNTKSFNTEFFKAAIVKDPEVWFQYFKDWFLKLSNFKTLPVC